MIDGGSFGIALARHFRMSKTIFASAVLLVAVVSAAEVPLEVSNVVTGPQSHVRLTNTGTQTVTAWSLAATTESGGRKRREVYTVDGYLSELTHGLPNAEEHRERLMPGQSREIPLDALPAGATVEPVAAVLDDGTAIGDEAALTQIFTRRAKERDALKAVSEAFAEVLPARHGADAIAALTERFNALVQQDNSIPCRAALEAVQSLQRGMPAEQVDQLLEEYADFVKREFDLAAKHALRRN
jgi:hypothetical protein